MKATVSLDSLWQFILTLSPGNRDWLFRKLEQDAREREEDEEYISKEEILAGVDAALKELKLKREGKLKPVSAEEFLEELRNEN